MTNPRPESGSRASILYRMRALVGAEKLAKWAEISDATIEAVCTAKRELTVISTEALIRAAGAHPLRALQILADEYSRRFIRADAWLVGNDVVEYVERGASLLRIGRLDAEVMPVCKCGDPVTLIKVCMTCQSRR